MRLQTNVELCAKYPEIEEKLKIIEFFDKYGLSPTRDAFKVSRSSVYLWKQRLKNSGGKLASLINQSKKPKKVRRMYLDKNIYDFIYDLRRKYPSLSKDKIKPLLDDFCQRQNLSSISASTIGKIIKRNHLFFYLHNRSKKRSRKDKKRVFGYEIKELGDLVQMDAIVKFNQGVRRYVITAIETQSKFAFAYSYKHLSSKSAADFVSKLIQVAPFPIKAIQTDNGSEFLKSAEEAMEKNGIVHFFTYPRSPKSNAFIERFNRTIQEEHINHNEQALFESTEIFNNNLMDYLLFYNTKRIHSRIYGKVPMDYIIQKSNMYMTDTFACKK
jgi:transposase InsO family protein